MQASAEHVQYQLPNEHSRVGFLLEVIQCSDPGLQAAMASIKTDNGPGTTLRPQLLIYCPMTQLLRKDQMDKREDLHKFHQLWILPLPPLRSQALGKLGFTFITTKLVNIGTLQMSKGRN